MSRPFAVLGAALLLAGVRVVATSVIPPTFAELISQAERVIVAEVTDVRSRRAGGDIVTEVTFRVDRTLKGEHRAVAVLEFPGGFVGDEAVEVTGMPRFRLGDRDILFIRDSVRTISPLVGFMHGRFRITFDPATGDQFVSQYNFQPFTTQQLGGAAAAVRQAPQRAIPLGEFETQITSALRAQAAR
jgi:hypothetical protein